MKIAYISLPEKFHNTLFEKQLEDAVEQKFGAHTISGRVALDSPTFDLICDTDIVVTFRGYVDEQVLWVLRVALTLHKPVWMWNGWTFEEYHEVKCKPDIRYATHTTRA